MSASLVGSEMCIRDRSLRYHAHGKTAPLPCKRRSRSATMQMEESLRYHCLLYTSDAADDM
eukprot:11319349-Alexandrium_andersonii.AAC.1